MEEKNEKQNEKSKVLIICIVIAILILLFLLIITDLWCYLVFFSPYIILLTGLTLSIRRIARLKKGTVSKEVAW